MCEESLAVTKIKSDSIFFFGYAQQFSGCASETSTLYDKNRNILTSDILRCNCPRFYAG